METKFVTVLAEKTKDGRIIYRGGQPKPSKHIDPLIFVLIGWVSVVALALMTIVIFSVPAETTVGVTDYTAYLTENNENPGSIVRMYKIVTTTPTPYPEYEAEKEEVDAHTLEMLALVIYQEAGGDACSNNTRQMVGEVVLNRVADSRFPDTMEEVLTQKQQYGRLYWTGIVWPERAIHEGEAHAVERAYEIAKKLLTSTDRLLPDDVIFQAEFKQGTETVAESDGFYFCR